MKKLTESMIQRSIMEYLASCKIFAIRVNSGTHFMQSNGKRYATHLAAPGTADILAFRVRYRGVDDQGAWCSFTEIMPVWMEVKTATGKQSELQKSFQAQVEEFGHKYFVVRDVEDVRKAVYE